MASRTVLDGINADKIASNSPLTERLLSRLMKTGKIAATISAALKDTSSYVCLIIKS